MDLISVHIAKTAGMSFLRILHAIYGQQGILEDYRGKPYELCQYHSSATNALIDELPSSIKVIHGHFSSVKYAKFFPSTKFIVWIRNPVSRLISHYHYLFAKHNIEDTLHQKIREGQMTFMDFARQSIMINHMTKSYVPLELFDRFFFVGIMEYFPHDLRRLAKSLAWPTFEVPRENSAKAKNYESFSLSAAEMEELYFLNKDDFKLYNMALEKRINA